MLSRGEENELTLHGQYLFTKWFISLHRYNATSKQRKLICNYIENHAEELLSKYPSDPCDYESISTASYNMIVEAIASTLGECK